MYNNIPCFLQFVMHHACFPVENVNTNAKFDYKIKSVLCT